MIKTLLKLILLVIITENQAMAGHTVTDDRYLEQSERSSKGLLAVLGVATVGIIGTAISKQKERDHANITKSEKIDNNKCPISAPNGSYYRYELDYKHVIQAKETGWLYGTTPSTGFTPTCQAYRTKKHQINEVKFCTPVMPNNGGGTIQSWYLGITPGVLRLNDDTAMIPIVVIN